MKDLIGRKVKGFRFESRKHKGLYYAPAMDKHIGKVGEITGYGSERDCYRIDFNGDSWDYPASEIESHLVDEWVVGQEYEFSDGIRWEKRVLLAVLPEELKCRYIVSSSINPRGWYYMSEIRHINQPNKEILEQIEVLEKELENLKSKVK